VIADLTRPERALCDGYARGEVVDLRTGDPVRDDPATSATWGPDRTVRATVVAELLLGAGAREPRLRLSGARITGRLDLSYADLAGPVEFADCGFDAEVSFAEATTRSIGFLRCHLPGLDCDTIAVRSHLVLVGSRIGQLSLYNAGIEGQLDLSGAHLSGPGEMVLNGELLRVGGSLYAYDMVAHGAVHLPNASVSGRLELDRARLLHPGNLVLFGIDLAVGGNLRYRDGTVDGQILLRGARIGGSLDLARTRLSAPVNGEVLSAARITLGHDFNGEAMVTEGGIRLHGARIDGAIEWHGARLRNPGGNAVTAYRLSVGGGVFCTKGFQAEGMLNLPSGLISGRLNVRGALLRNPGDTALNLNGTTIEGNLDGREGLTVEGRVSLWQTVVTGQVDLAGARLANPGGSVLGAQQLRTRALLLGPDTVLDGGVDLRGATVGTLRDDPAHWPATVRLDGLSYDAVEPTLPAARRLAWLRRDPDGYLPRTYEQLAAAYRRLGNDHDARAVLAAKQRHRTESGSLPAKAWGYLQEVTVGYGYRPGRAGGWLLTLLVLGTVLFALHRPAQVEPGRGPAFHPLVYTIDLLLPIVDFGQESAYQPAGWTQWLAYGLIAAGWILATTVAAGLAHVLKRQ